MKSLLYMAIGIAVCCPLIAQDHLVITWFHLLPDANGHRIDATLSNMEKLSGTAAIIRLQNSPHLLNLRGDVDLTIDGTRVRADEVVIEDSGEIKPSGNVRVTMSK